MSRSRKIVLYLILPPVLFVVAIGLVLFLYLQFHKTPEMDITSQGFSLKAIEINEGETIRFVNSSNVTQVLCLGQDSMCDTLAVAPIALKMPGIQLKPGDTINVAFEQYGTYNITSTNVKGINLKITVNPAA
jgi:plastocyanin